MTPETKKKIRMGVLAAVGLSMVGYMAFDMLISQSSTPPPIASNVTEPNLEFMQEAASLSPAPQFEAHGEQLQPESRDVLLPATAYDASQAQTVITYQPSQKAQDVLNSLEATYLSKVNTDKLNAQIAEEKSQQSLEALAPMPQTVVETTVQPSTETASIIDAIQVKSIVVTPKRTTAWLSVNGENIPVEYGVWVGDVRVVNITKDFVRFNNKQGKGFTKYVPSAMNPPIVKEPVNAPF